MAARHGPLSNPRECRSARRSERARTRRRWESVGWGLRQAAKDDVGDFMRDVRIDFGRIGRGIVHMPHRDSDRGFGVERQLAGQHFECDHGQRVDVRFGVAIKPLACSGEMYCTVPMLSAASVSASSLKPFAMPKSTTLARPC